MASDANSVSLRTYIYVCVCKFLLKSAHSCVQLALTLYLQLMETKPGVAIKRFIHSSFNNYLSSTCCVPGTCQGSSLIRRDMASKLPVRREVNTSRNLQNQNRKQGGTRWYGRTGWGREHWSG